jgi:hypothetical protein
LRYNAISAMFLANFSVACHHLKIVSQFELKTKAKTLIELGDPCTESFYFWETKTKIFGRVMISKNKEIN